MCAAGALATLVVAAIAWSGREPRPSAGAPNDAAAGGGYEREVTIRAGDGAALGATLAIPAGGGPFPVVVLVGGSGPTDRNYFSPPAFAGFALLADALRAGGVASLRFDERGVGTSDGVAESVTVQQLAGDVQSLVEFARSQPETTGAPAGVLGHSEGGLIAAMVAAAGDVDLLVLLSAPGIPVLQVFVDQQIRHFETQGVAGTTLDELRVAVTELYVAIGGGATDVDRELDALAEATAAVTGGHDPASTVETRRELNRAIYVTPWVRSIVLLEPGDYLRQVRAPVLAINGTADLIVDHRANLDAIERHLAASGSETSVARVPGLDHLLQGDVQASEIAGFDPDITGLILGWIHEHRGNDTDTAPRPR